MKYSGAMYSADSTLRVNAPLSSAMRAEPKSPRRKRPSPSMNTFSGFMFLCTMPFSAQISSARERSRPISIASSRPRGSRLILFLRFSLSSIRMNTS